MKSFIRALTPNVMLRAYRTQRLRWDMRKSRTKSRQLVFSEIYQNNLWGGTRGNYSSGSGSKADVTESYVACIRGLIQDNRIRRVVDLGCGDFEVGRRLLFADVTYIGCDIVPDVIARNKAIFESQYTHFKTLDLVTDPLPPGELCIIRQVFQHLANDDIAVILRKAKQYPLVAITDEQVIGDSYRINLDMPPYHGTRRVFGQGLKLERAPFNEHFEILLEHSSGSEPSPIFDTYLRTILIRN